MEQNLGRCPINGVCKVVVVRISSKPSIPNLYEGSSTINLRTTTKLTVGIRVVLVPMPMKIGDSPPLIQSQTRSQARTKYDVVIMIIIIIIIILIIITIVGTEYRVSFIHSMTIMPPP